MKDKILKIINSDLVSNIIIGTSQIDIYFKDVGFFLNSKEIKSIENSEKIITRINKRLKKV